MRRLALACLAAAFAAGCVEHTRRAELPRVVAAEEAAGWTRTGAAFAPVQSRWRYAGTTGGEHIVVLRGAKRDRVLALSASEFVMPAAMAYTKDESRWIPLKEIRRTRPDGSFDIDFARLPAPEIDAARDPSLGRDAVRKGGL